MTVMVTNDQGMRWGAQVRSGHWMRGRSVKLTAAERQGFISHLGAFVRERSELLGRHYSISGGTFSCVRWPEELLPLPRTTILEVIRQEIDAPEIGAALRGKTTEEYVENLRCVALVLEMEFLSRDQWLQQQEKSAAMLYQEDLILAVVRRFADFGPFEFADATDSDGPVEATEAKTRGGLRGLIRRIMQSK